MSNSFKGQDVLIQAAVKKDPPGRSRDKKRDGRNRRPKKGRPVEKAGPEGDPRHHAGPENADPHTHKEYRESDAEAFDPRAGGD